MFCISLLYLIHDNFTLYIFYLSLYNAPPLVPGYALIFRKHKMSVKLFKTKDFYIFDGLP